MKRRLLPWLMLLAAVGLCAYWVSANWYQLALIQGDSMRPTYSPLEFVIVDKTVSDYARADVVAVSSRSTGGDIVKRIVALPGDTVLIRDGTLYVNGVASTAATRPIAYAGNAQTEIRLAQDELFLLGDNPAQSHDSRYPDVGRVKRDNILGLIIPNKSPR